MKLYNPINFPFSSELQKHTLLKMSEFNSNLVYVLDIEIPNDLRDIINNWLANKGISKIINLRSFKRKHQSFGPKDCHLDVKGDYSLIHSSLVIPVEGCKDTVQYWYDGPRTLENTTKSGGPKYIKIHWDEEPKYLGDVEIFTTPVLCKVDIPHSAYSRPDEYRTTCTIRFQDNESFDYLSDKLSICSS